ncbi:MAG: V-type ATPase 116kDa subunit family protein, partial [Sedimentisphaerales bacterium]
SIEIEKEKKFLDKIDGERENIRERQRSIQQDILKLEDIRRQVYLYGFGLSDVPFKTKHSFLNIQTGRIPVSNIEKFETALKDLPSLNIALGREEEMAHFLLISMKRDTEQIKKILSQAAWTNIELPEEVKSIKADVFNEISLKLGSLTEEQKNLEQKATNLIKEQEKPLRNIWVNLRVTELLSRIQANFKSSSRTVIFTGWLPLSQKEKLSKRIQDSCGNRCTIDPTPFVMPLYLAMFGLMFADAGQGAVLALAGILGMKHFRPIAKRQGYFKLSWLIVWCGVSSIFFGILFGSYFGKSLFPPLWFNYHGIVSGHEVEGSTISSINDILAITLYFGIFVIFVGLAFNWVNLIRTRQWTELFFDKGGVFGAWIYAGGVYLLSHLFKNGSENLPSGRHAFLFVGLPVLLLFFKEPYHYFQHGKSSGQEHEVKKFNPVMTLNWLMHWIVELMEIFSGYLANTLSFLRIAGLGIAHASLMIAFFTMAGMAPGIFSVVILVLGNILVICLEGLSAGVQALRLSYYEFFTKFFHGTGKLYNPISLKST